MTRSSIPYAVAVFSFVFTLLVGFVVYSLVVGTRAPVYEVYSHPVPVANLENKRDKLIDKAIVHAGETLYIYRESCWTYYMPGKINRTLVGKEGPPIVLPVIPVGTDFPETCQGIVGMLPLPRELKPQRYTLIASIDFDTGWLTSVRVRWGNVTFEVVP